MTTEINIASPDFKADPYPTFTETRTEDPVRQMTMPGNRKGWLITRYDDADLVLRDPRFVKDLRHALTLEEIAQQFPARQDADRCAQYSQLS